MRKVKRRADLVLVIVTAALFVLAAALFYFLPTIDNAIAANPAGVAYDPVAVIVEGFNILISFRFASRRYTLVFIVGCCLAAFFLFWLVTLIIKKKPLKLINWFVYLLFTFGCCLITLSMVLSTARTVELVNGVKLNQNIVDDLLDKYAVYRLKSNPDVAPFLLYNFISLIAGWVVVGLVGVVTLLIVTAPIVSGIAMYKGDKYVKVEEEEAPEVSPEELARQKREQELISYVEYKAGIESRNKEYEDICRANGIALPGDEVEEEDDDEAYYRETAKNLPCLHEPFEEPAPEVDEDEEYYKRLSEELMVFKLAKASQDVTLERYYQETIAGLDMFKGDKESANLRRHTEARKEYYEKLAKELPCLQYQKDPVDPEVK